MIGRCVRILFLSSAALWAVMAISCGARETTRSRYASTPRVDQSRPSPLPKPAPKVDCTSACETYGRCVAQDGQCFLSATSDADCAEPKRVAGLRLASVCEEHGECHAKQGVCRAMTESNCDSSQDCKDHGLCHFDGGSCIATAIACTASKDCKKWGRCTEVVGKCTATPADCTAHPHCKEIGWCAVSADGDCEANDEAGCASSAACMRSGECHFLVRPNGRKTCAPRSTADCAGSENCKKLGWCELIDERCDKRR